MTGRVGGDAQPRILLWAVAIGALLLASDAWLLGWQAGQRLDRQQEAIAALKVRLAGYE